MMPVKRTPALMGDFFNLPMAEATVLAASEDARLRLQPTVGSIGQAIKVTSSGSRRYLQQVEAYRDEHGKPLAVDAPPIIAFESASAFGDVWALTALWHELGFDQLQRVFRRTRYEIDVEALLRVMDALLDQHEAVEQTVAELLRPLVDQDLPVVFYDMTTIRAAGLSKQDQDFRKYGMSKEEMIARQFTLGVAQTADGLPLYHEEFDGNTAEDTTLKPTIEKLMSRFAARRMIVASDRGLLSQENLAELQAITLPCETPLEFLQAVPGRRYGEVANAVAPLHAAQFAQAKDETLGETRWNNLRLIIAYNPDTATAQTAARTDTIAKLEQQAMQ